MTNAAAKGRKLFFLTAAFALLAAILAAPAAEATRTLPALAEPAQTPQRATLDVLEGATPKPPTEPEKRLRLFDDPGWPTHPLEGVQISKTASGVFDLGLDCNILGKGGLSKDCGSPSFQGLWHDPTTGLAYARNRWYDPRNASWLSEDPVGPYDSTNLYAFVAWNPHEYRDPTGEVIGIDNLVGGVVSVGIGFGVSKLCEATAETDEEREQCEYTWADAGVDFTLGAVTSGLSSISKLKHVGKLGRVAIRGGAEVATDVGLEAVRCAAKGQECSTEDLVRGAVRNLAIGEAGAHVARKAAPLVGRGTRWLSDRVGGSGARRGSGSFADWAREGVEAGAEATARQFEEVAESFRVPYGGRAPGNAARDAMISGNRARSAALRAKYGQRIGPRVKNIDGRMYGLKPSSGGGRRWFRMNRPSAQAGVQTHHLISNPIVDAMEQIGISRQTALALRNNPALQRMSSPGGHIGYEKWHRAYDDYMVDYILRRGRGFRIRDFFDEITQYYSSGDPLRRIPGVNLSNP